MMHFEFLRLPDGRAWIGEGPFESFEQLPEGGGAFYVNDFQLSDPRPWKRPHHLIELAPGEYPDFLEGHEPPRISWVKPRPEWFKMAFRRTRKDVLSHRLKKMVPVVTEHGTLESGDLLSLLPPLLKEPTHSWAYAHVTPDSGFAGATPELLFQSDAESVRTMALAGTAKPGGRDQFAADVKEIEEHELVADFLAQRLSGLGEVERQPRGLCETGGLLHFQTHLSVKGSTLPPPSELVSWLHPTPAVGCLPREPEWLDRLRGYRETLEAPGFFGAPFGFASATECHMVVAIRGVAWSGESVSLPSGVGIVSGSAFDHEWRELRLKREAVLRMLNLQSANALLAA